MLVTAAVRYTLISVETMSLIRTGLCDRNAWRVRTRSKTNIAASIVIVVHFGHHSSTKELSPTTRSA
jgi:hypothetical protein